MTVVGPLSAQPQAWLWSAQALLKQWSLNRQRHCLDLRSSQAYDMVHLVPSTSIPLSTLDQRFGQLPPKNIGVTFLILTDSDSTQFKGQSIDQHLRSRGWTIDGMITIPLRDPSERDFWDYANSLKILGSSRQGAELLFRPSPILEAWIETIERDIVKRTTRFEGRSLDIGCGSGRDMGYLSSRKFHWNLSGLDDWEKALERASIMVSSINPTRKVNCIYAEIDEKKGNMRPLSAEGEVNLRTIFNEKCDLVCVIRCFPKGLFGQLHLVVKDGGYLIFSHFTNPKTKADKYDSPPKEGRVKGGEVEKLLRKGCKRWNVLRAEYSKSEDGRPLWDVVAKLEPL